MNIDFHVHCDSANPKDWNTFSAVCKQNDTIVCICGGSPRGDHEPAYPPNSIVLKAAQAHSKTFIPLAYVDLWDKKISGKAIKSYARQGFRGLKFIDPYYPYDHDFYMPAYEMAEELKLPVLFHTGLYRPSGAHAKTRHPALLNMHPARLDRIARAFPELKIVMAHMGTCLWRFEGAQLIKLHPNLYADLAGYGNYRIKPEILATHFDGDNGLENTDFQVWGKLILGSDAYFTYPHLIKAANTAYRKLLAKCKVPNNIMQKIMGQKVSQWFEN